MGRLIDDEVKQKLLDSLAEEPTMVLSTAYAYAKNYVMYGEDITKAWTTAVQQASIIEQIKVKAQAEAYDSFKREYETRLKADKMATFKEFRDKLSKWMFHNSESVCGNNMIDIDYLEGHMDELLYELGIYEVNEDDT